MFPGLKGLYSFPSVDEASAEGIVAVGGNLSPEMLVSAYAQGIFPWFSDNDPLLWWAPDPRFVLYPERLHVSRSMQRSLRRGDFRVSMDTDFPGVIACCRHVPRPGQDGTWITPGMEEAYTELHRLGYAHSVEVWSEGQLVGGLYGVSLGNLFFGESMFSHRPNASKYGFIELVGFLVERGFDLIDCQVHTPHLESLGAEEIPRELFMEHLGDGLEYPTFAKSWTEDFRGEGNRG